MLLTLLILPLLSFFFSGLLGRIIGVRGSQLISCLMLLISTILSILIYIEVTINKINMKINLFNWINSEILNINICFNIDSLTCSMLIPVLIISTLVHIYSIGYMENDPHNQRFFSYLSLFTFMMLILVTSENYLLLFVGWEGVGVCSYLLVSFWFTRVEAIKSSMSAFFTNRVGDCIFTIGIFSIIYLMGSLNFSLVFALAGYFNKNIITIIGLCLLLGAMAKSSQLGLHIWLPQAMEGPTPVSALIHAATMVTAGVYLLIRSSPLIDYSDIVLNTCLWIGALTTIFSSIIGFFQYDIKKVIAYSTMSQLGMMVIAIGLSCYNLALYHLINHAFYKGLLFLGAGSIIHATNDNQDFRKYGGFISFLPLTYSVMLIASCSLIAIPFLSGYFSKDFILESLLGEIKRSSNNLLLINNNYIIFYISCIGAIFTTLYSIKVLYFTFLSNPNGPKYNYNINIQESNIFITLPLIILSIFSIYFGYISQEIYLNIGLNNLQDNSIFVYPNNESKLYVEYNANINNKLLPLLLTIVNIFISLFFFEKLKKILIMVKLTNIGYNLYCFFNRRLFIDYIYNKFIILYFILYTGGWSRKYLDNGILEIIGPHGFKKFFLFISNKFNSKNTGKIKDYVLYIIGFTLNISFIYIYIYIL